MFFWPKSGQIWPKIGIFGHFGARPCWFIWCPVGGLVGGCGAGCITQDTYLLYKILITFKHSPVNSLGHQECVHCLELREPLLNHIGDFTNAHLKSET